MDNEKVRRAWQALEHHCLTCDETHEPYYDGHLFRKRCCGAVCGEEAPSMPPARRTAMQDNVTQAVIRAESVVNSSEALRMYGSCEWEELSQDGQLWMAKIVSLASTAQPEVKALVEALEKMRDRYASQAKFADHEPAAYFRDFVSGLDAALAAYHEAQP